MYDSLERSFYLFIYLFIDLLSIYLPIHLFIYLFIYRSGNTHGIQNMNVFW